MRLTALGVLIALFAPGSQADERAPRFEVVVIKPSAGAGPATFDPGFIHIPAVPVRLLIVQAYKLRGNQIDGPSWLNGPPYFDFTARIPQGAAKAQIPEMYQAVLADRFNLKFHWESRIDAVYELATEKGGVKLKKSDPASRPSMMIGRNGHYSAPSTTLEQFAMILSAHVGRQVFDKTGIAGTFDIDFDAEPPEALRQPQEAGSQAGGEPPDIFPVLHSLGLKLEPQKAEVKHFVVDSLLKIPTEN
jgi:uncharacterized protein (TIGR03435 family)